MELFYTDGVFQWVNVAIFLFPLIVCCVTAYIQAKDGEDGHTVLWLTTGALLAALVIELVLYLLFYTIPTWAGTTIVLFIAGPVLAAYIGRRRGGTK